MDFENMRSFLAQHGQDEDLSRHAMEVIERFASVVSAGTYRLKAAAEIDPKEAAGAVSAAIGKPVKQVIFVAASAPDPKLADANGKFDGNLLWRQIDFCLWDHIHSGHHYTLWSGFPKKRRQVGNQLWELLRETIGATIDDALMNGLPKELGYDLRSACQKHVWYSLFYYVGFAINGVVDRCQRLAALIELLASAIPLGEKRNAPGIWFVLTA